MVASCVVVSGLAVVVVVGVVIAAVAGLVGGDADVAGVEVEVEAGGFVSEASVVVVELAAVVVVELAIVVLLV